MITIELHCHTIFSRDSLLAPEKLLAAARRKGIDRVAITDHNSIQGALRAQQLDPARVIVGEEILTTGGELLAYFVQEEVPAGLPPSEAIAHLRTQGAFISVAHPFDQMRKGHWSPAVLQDILPFVDAIETFNARAMYPGSNALAEQFARQHNVPGTAGSDAHTAFELGRATLTLPDFVDAEGLRRALPEAQARLRPSGMWVHLTSRYAVWRKKIAAP